MVGALFTQCPLIPHGGKMKKRILPILCAALCFGLVGQKWRASVKTLPWLALIACVCTVGFTLIDNVITPLWYGYSAKAIGAYWFASIPFMISQVVCTAVSTVLLLLPLGKAFSLIKKQLF